jgi:AraC family transcriptional regulator
MPETRIMISERGKVRPASPVPPLLSSAQLWWDGFLLEIYDLPAGEFGTPAIFPKYLICLSLTPAPYRKIWKEGGAEHVCHVLPGEVGLIARHEVYGMRWEANRLLCLTIDDAVIDRLTMDIRGGRPPGFQKIPSKQDDVLRQLLALLERDVRLASPAGRLYGESLATAATVYALQHYPESGHRIVEVRGGMPKARLRLVIEYVWANLDRNPGLAELAGVSGLSTFHFARMFKASTGRTVHQFVLDCRIERAKELLRMPHARAADVALAVGFSSQTHFTTMFRRRVGATPGEYRTSLLR